MAVNYDALINQINAEQAKQEQAAREANALLEKQAAATDTLLPFFIVAAISSRTISEILSKIFICMLPP